MSIFKKCPALRTSLCIVLFGTVMVHTAFAQSTVIVKWGTQASTDTDGNSLLRYNDVFYDITAAGTPYQKLLDLNADGTLDSSGSTGLVELGFFDTDSSATYAPNVDASNPFVGEWTPITMQTYIGQDWKSSGTNPDGVSYVVPDGEFYFITEFNSTSNYDPGANTLNATTAYSNFESNGGATGGIEVRGDTSIISAADFDARMEALTTVAYDAGSDTAKPILGIRFYESSVTGQPADGDRYNTLVNTNWRWEPHTAVGTTVNEITLYDWDDGQLSDTSYFEFDNSAGNTKGAKVGTSNTTVNSDKYAATVTYYDGAGGMDVSGSSHIFSGLDGSGNLVVGNDRTLTLHTNSGSDGSFSGDINNGSDGEGATTLLKIGAGNQILSGDVQLAGSSAGWLDVSEGELILDSGSKDISAEYLTGAAGTTLELRDFENASGGSGLILGFANTSDAMTFAGDLEINGTQARITVASGTSAADHTKEQIISGSLKEGTGSNHNLVKDGVGKLRLTGDSSSSYNDSITVYNGTLILGDGSDSGADFHSDTNIIVSNGKLEIAANESITNTVSGDTDASYKSIVGGSGTLGTLTIGDQSGEIDYVSPGQGISSSLTPSKKQVNLDANESGSIGNFTVTTLNWNDGGVYDWQIQDFDPSGGTAGTDWDLLSINDLNFESGQTFDINIMAINNTDGSQGAPGSPANLWGQYTETAGFKFMSASGTVTGIGTGDVTSSFDIRADDFYYAADNWFGNWGVWRDGGDFYLTYSAVPEPSTYIMVTGLLMVPGASYVRRFRKKKNGQTDTEFEEEISS